MSQNRGTNWDFSAILAERSQKTKLRSKTSNCSQAISPPRGRKKKSKYYTRPVFKDPAEKPPSVPRRDRYTRMVPKTTPVEQQSDEALDLEHRSSFLLALRGDLGRKHEDEDDAIQPCSRTQYRLKHLVGKPKSEEKLDLEHDATLEQRLLERQQQRKVVRRRQKSSDSTVTCSNLDSLEAKRLTSKKPLHLGRTQSNISSIRRQVNEIVIETIHPPVKKTEPLRSIPTNPQPDEQREPSEAIDDTKEDSPVEEKPVQQPTGCSACLSLF